MCKWQKKIKITKYIIYGIDHLGVTFFIFHNWKSQWAQLCLGKHVGMILNHNLEKSKNLAIITCQTIQSGHKGSFYFRCQFPLIWPPFKLFSEAIHREGKKGLMDPDGQSDSHGCLIISHMLLRHTALWCAEARCVFHPAVRLPFLLCWDKVDALNANMSVWKAHGWIWHQGQA